MDKKTSARVSRKRLPEEAIGWILRDHGSRRAKQASAAPSRERKSVRDWERSRRETTRTTQPRPRRIINFVGPVMLFAFSRDVPTNGSGASVSWEGLGLTINF